jgi:branched-chain amino acid transport system permease protein
MGLLFALLAVFAALLLSAPAGQAQTMAAPLSTSTPAPSPAETSGTSESFPNTINGVLRNAGQPVAGVTIRATGEGFSGEAVSSATGGWSIGVPVQGTYEVELDVSTLPEGVTLAEGAQNPRQVTFANTSNAGAIFPLGEGIVVQSQSFGELLAERMLAGLSFGLLLALASVGLSLIFGTTGLTNFAHGEMVTLGAVLMFFFSGMGMPVWLAAVLAVVGGGLSGYLQDSGLWKPLRRRGTGIIPMMIVSIGLALAARYTIQLFFGGSTQQLPGARSPQIELGSVSISQNTLVSLVISAVVVVAVALLVR